MRTALFAHAPLAQVRFERTGDWLCLKRTCNWLCLLDDLDPVPIELRRSFAMTCTSRYPLFWG
jgi:hypothetical protein